MNMHLPLRRRCIPADMENSQLQLSSIPPTAENFWTLFPPTTHSDNRHSLVARRFKDALFSAVAAKYATNGSDRSLPFPSEQLKSDIERRLPERFPSFHTPTHLPYASMIQRAIAEMGEEDGLSEESISEFIVNEFEDLPWAHSAFLGRHLGKLCERGELVKSKCGRYNFKVEGKEVKRKKRRRKSSGRTQRQVVKSADETEEDCDRKKRSKKLRIIGACAEVVTSKGTEEQNHSLTEVIVGAEDGDKAQGGQAVLDELEEVQEDEIIGKHHGKKIKYKDGPKDFDWQKKLRNQVIIGLQAPVTIKGKRKGLLGEEVHEAEEGDHAKGGQRSLSRKKVDGAEGDCAQAGQTEVLDKFKVVQEIEMFDEHHQEERQGEMMEQPTEGASKGSNEEGGPSEEGTSDFFDAISSHGNAEQNGVIDAEGCKKLREENENFEFFDAKSDHGDNGAKGKNDSQSSKGKILGEVSNKQNRRQLLSKVIDNQTGTSKGCEAEDPQLPKEQPQVRWPSEMTGTPSSTSIAVSPPLKHQMETPKHSEQGMPSPSEVEKNENSETLLSSDIICSPKSHPRGHRGRGRPRKLKVQETLATSLSSSTQDCDQQNLESKVEGREKFGLGDVTNHVDQQQLKLPRGRGRGRGRPRVVRQDKTSISETFSCSSHLHHQQSSEKRRRGRPPKQKFDEDGASKDISTTLENGQQEENGRGRGCERPSRGI